MSNAKAFLDRIDALIAERKVPFRSARAWCVAASVSPNYIGTLRSRADTGEVTDVKMEQVARLARAAGLDISELIGDRIAGTLPSADRTVEWAIENFEWSGDLQPAQVETIVDSVRREAARGTTELPAKFWTARIRKLAQTALESTAKSHVRRAAK